MRSICTNYNRNPQQKVIFFSYIFVFDCFELASQIANGERIRRSAARQAASLNKLRQLKTTKNVREKMQSENVESVVSTIVLPKSALRKRSRCYWETRSNVKGQHAPTRTDNQRQKYMKKINKKKITFRCGFCL